MPSGRLIAGVDEAGRGALAGDVVAAAVIFASPRHVPDGVKDSKKLSAKRRTYLEGQIKKQALSWAIGRANPREIDRLNILQASMLAMQRAIEQLDADLVIVDGPHCPQCKCSVRGVIGADRRLAIVSAASILAKVHRDREMLALEARYSGYEFGQHKGYPTKRHRYLLRRIGPSPAHRMSYRPVRELAASGNSA